MCDQTWGRMLISGQAAFLAILILSEREEAAAWAQQDFAVLRDVLVLAWVKC